MTEKFERREPENLKRYKWADDDFDIGGEIFLWCLVGGIVLFLAVEVV